MKNFATIIIGAKQREVPKCGRRICLRAAYAKEECTAPVRTVTSAVRVVGGSEAMVSVKTAKPVPKDKIFEVMRLIRAKTVAPPVSAGDVIISGVFGTDIIATKSVE